MVQQNNNRNNSVHVQILMKFSEFNLHCVQKKTSTFVFLHNSYKK